MMENKIGSDARCNSSCFCNNYLFNTLEYLKFTDFYAHNYNYMKVPCKRRSSVNSRAWLRRFDDVTRVEKSCVAKAKKKK